jgi:hypothetical protein
MAESLLPVTHW